VLMSAVKSACPSLQSPQGVRLLRQLQLLLDQQLLQSALVLLFLQQDLCA
jgi:hypothetical protein